MKLRPYQEQQLDSIWLGLSNGSNRLLVKSPTGTGKTVMFAHALQRLESWLEQFPRHDRKMLVIAHREELLDQAADKIQRTNPGLMVSVEQGSRYANLHGDVIVASIQTLQAMKFRRLKRLLTRCTPRVVIVDEAHHAAAATYRTALAHLGFLPPSGQDRDNIEAATHDDLAEMQAALAGWDARAPRDRLLVGVTATPNRSDAIGLGCVFQSIAYSYELKQAIADGWLAPIVSWVVETDTDLDSVRITAGDFNQKQLAEAVNNAKRNHQALAAWREHAEHVPTIGFTVDVAHAHEAARVFQEAGYRFEAVSGETPKEDRRLLLRQFQEGQIEGLMNCMVLTEGTDLPRAGCILHLKPTKSATLYEQMTGRGLRPLPGDPVGPERLEAVARGATLAKPHCILIDLVDVAKRHSLQAAPVLYGLPPGLMVKGKQLGDVEDDIDALRQKTPNLEELLAGEHMTLEALRARAERFDVWTVPELGAFGNGRALNWIKVADDTFRLSYPWSDGTETLEVSRNLLEQFQVTVTLRPIDNPTAKRQRTIADGIPDADVAAGLAEAFVLEQRRSVTKLKGKDEPWRRRPASEKQIAYLRKLAARNPGLVVPKDCTAGEASDLIDLVNARRR